MSLFTNGNARVTRLIIIQLGLGQVVLVLNAIQGFLPTFGLSQVALQRSAAILAVSCICIKGGELFFNKIATLFKNYDGTPPAIPPVASPLSTGNTETITKP